MRRHGSPGLFYAIRKIWSVMMSTRARGGLAASLPMLSIALFLAGCTGGSQNSAEALKQQFKNNSGYKQVPIAKFTGKVTVDGQAPAQGCRLFVILNDPQHLDANAHLPVPGLYTGCDAEGRFSFGDGVPSGAYVVSFVELASPIDASSSSTSAPKSGARFRGGRAATGVGSYRPPDRLKNLFNDPAKNERDARFKLDLQPPGRTDSAFDLAVAESEVAAPSPNAVTRIQVPN
jgi:hypothetical protein